MTKDLICDQVSFDFKFLKFVVTRDNLPKKLESLLEYVLTFKFEPLSELSQFEADFKIFIQKLTGAGYLIDHVNKCKEILDNIKLLRSKETEAWQMRREEQLKEILKILKETYKTTPFTDVLDLNNGRCLGLELEKDPFELSSPSRFICNTRKLYNRRILEELLNRKQLRFSNGSYSNI
jgi:hypothetical protein